MRSGRWKLLALFIMRKSVHICLAPEETRGQDFTSLFAHPAERLHTNKEEVIVPALDRQCRRGLAMPADDQDVALPDGKVLTNPLPLQASHRSTQIDKVVLAL